MFQCNKCGVCCRDLIVKTGECHLGLFLLPDEIHLFPENMISPMWGIGLKGKSRPRPETIGVLQLNVKDCPHVTSDNLCRIYDKRPIICRAHPLLVVIYEDAVLSASVDRKCRAADIVPSMQSVKLKEYFVDEILKANVAAALYLQNMFRQSCGLIWLFDLRENKWKKVEPSSFPYLKAIDRHNIARNYTP